MQSVDTLELIQKISPKITKKYYVEIRTNYCHSLLIDILLMNERNTNYSCVSGYYGYNLIIFQMTMTMTVKPTLLSRIYTIISHVLKNVVDLISYGFA